MAKKGLLLLAVTAVLVAAAAIALRTREPGPVVPKDMVAIHRAQQQLPANEVGAIQALRVLSAVEAVQLAEHSRYVSPKELKSAGLLDPAWPRVNPASYNINCEVRQKPMGFACYADPVSPRDTYYFVNPSQVVRFEKNRRPDENSPVFGLPKENL